MMRGVRVGRWDASATGPGGRTVAATEDGLSTSMESRAAVLRVVAISATTGATL
jgi:hypothetical protein